MTDIDTQALIMQELQKFSELLTTFAEMLIDGDKDPVLDDGTALKSLARVSWVDDETGERIVHFYENLSPTTIRLSYYGNNGMMLTSTLGSDTGCVILLDRVGEALSRYYFG